MTRIAIVDDDARVLESWRAVLHERYDVFTFRDPFEAERFCQREHLDAALIELDTPGRDGLALLRVIKQLQPDMEVVIVTRRGSIELAVEATRAGALDFITKPVVDPMAIVVRIERVLERRRLAADNAALRDVVHPHSPETSLIGSSPPMQQLRRLIERFADSPAPVLIIGESGTGKELVARSVHLRSNRRSGPFVPVNCAAIAENLIDSELFGHERGAFTGAASNHKGLFEAANGGVLFLDEIGDVPASTQVRLLRALQEGEVRPIGSTASRKVDVRVVAATNVDLERAMDEGRFRRDLFFRLSTFQLAVPALRERGEDIVVLARRQLQRAALRSGTADKGLSDEACEVLRRHTWPGNVRELGNVMDYAVTLCDGAVVEPQHLPPYLVAQVSASRAESDDEQLYRVVRDRFDRGYLTELLRSCGGNLSEAARRSGIDRSNLRRMMQRLGIDTQGRVTAPTGDQDITRRSDVISIVSKSS